MSTSRVVPLNLVVAEVSPQARLRYAECAMAELYRLDLFGMGIDPSTIETASVGDLIGRQVAIANEGRWSRRGGSDQKSRR